MEKIAKKWNKLKFKMKKKRGMGQKNSQQL